MQNFVELFIFIYLFKMGLVLGEFMAAKASLPFTNAGAFTRIVLQTAAATFIAFQTCIQSCSCPTPFLSLSSQTWQ